MLSKNSPRSEWNEGLYLLCKLVEHSCEVVGGALLLQRAYKSDGVQEGRGCHR